MAVSSPTRGGRYSTRLRTHDNRYKKLRSGRLLKQWSPTQKKARKLLLEKHNIDVQVPRQNYFPLLSLPLEIRFQVYQCLFSASGSRVLKRAVESLRKLKVKSIGDGRIVFSKADKEYSISKPHRISALPNLQILRTCKQIQMEALLELYRVNTFEVTTRTPFRSNEAVFRLPQSVQLNKIRYLVLVTDTKVSRYQSCFTYEILKNMTSLRTLSVAMKTAFVHGGPDFNSALETLNLLLWVPNHVEIKFGVESDLKHHDHPTWICSDVLNMYVELFKDLRSAALSQWTYKVSIAYDKALANAQGFTVL